MPSAEAGSVKTAFLNDRTIETVYHGYVTVEMADEVRTAIGKLLKNAPGADWLIDASNASGFALAPRELTLGVFDMFKKHRGQRIAVVVPKAPMRMMATTFAFAFGLPMKSFETRDQALAFLKAPA